MIYVEDYHKTYGETVAVRGLSFEVTPGTVLGLVGPNGAGKTTTLRAIAGIIAPTLGRLLVAGHDVAIDPVAAKSALAYVPDDPKLFDALTVWEHLEFVAASYRITPWEEDATRLLEQFELTEKRDALAQELSRGMRQKVAICCGYLHRPSAILLDEPLTGLDPKAIRQMNDSVRQRAADGACIIISSHLLALIEDLCTHLLIVRRGESVFYGSLAEARSRYADLKEDGSDEETSIEEVFFRATEH